MVQQIIQSPVSKSSLLSPRKGIGISLIISFVAHIILLLFIQRVIPLRWAYSKLRTYNVELIRPVVEDLKEAEIPDIDAAHFKQEQPSSPEEIEDTISLDTKDKKYVSYARIIKERIIQNWEYPPEARKKIIEGNLHILFSLEKNGNLTRIEIKKGSGHEILDKEAIRAIRNAAPFPPFSASMTVARLNIKANFDYRLKKQK